MGNIYNEFGAAHSQQAANLQGQWDQVDATQQARAAMPAPSPAPVQQTHANFFQRIGMVGIGKVNALNAYRALSHSGPIVDSNNHPLKTAAHDVGTVGKVFFNGTAKLANQAYQEGKQAVDTGRMEAASLSNNPTAFRNANAQSQRDYQGFKNSGGLLNAGTATNAAESQRGDVKTGLKKIGGTTLEAASELAPMGALTKTAKTYKVGKGLVTAERFAKNASRGEKLAVVGKDVAKQAAIGAGAGGVGTAGAELAQNGRVSAKDVVTGAAKGAVIGGLFQGVGDAFGAGAKAVLSKMRGAKAAEGGMPDVMDTAKADKAAAVARTDIRVKGGGEETPVTVRTPVRPGVKDVSETYQIGVRRPTQIGVKDISTTDKVGVRAPVKMTDQQFEERFNQLSKAYNREHKALQKQVTPTELKATESKPVDNTIDGYNHSKELIDDHTAQLQQIESGLTGGQMVKDGEGGYKRITEHSPWYSQYYAEHGRAPSKAAYRDQAIKELESGRAPWGMSDTYKKLVSREKTPYDPKTDSTPNRVTTTKLTAKQKFQAAAIDRKYEKLMNDLLDEYHNGKLPEKTTVKQVSKTVTPAARLKKGTAAKPKLLDRTVTPAPKRNSGGSAQVAKIRAASARSAKQKTADPPAVRTTTLSKSTPQDKTPAGAGSSKVEVVRSNDNTPSNVKIVRSKGNAVAGSAIKAEARAVKKRLAGELDKATYESGSYAKEAENAVQLLHDNPEKARAIAFGQKAGNNPIHEVAVRRAVENRALADGDTMTLARLAGSGQHTATSEAAQRLGAEAFNADPASPVNAIREVLSARQQAFEKGKQSFTQELSRETSKVMAEAVHSPSVLEWHAFVDKLPESKGNTKLISALKSDEINPGKLAKMSSEDRQAVLREYVGDNAQKVNALFESKLLLKNQKAGMLSWAKKATNISPVVRKDLIQKIESLNHVLDPEEGKAFMRDLAATKLGVNVTQDEAKTIANLSKQVMAARDLRDGGGDRLAYGRAVVELGNYVSDLKTKSLNLRLSDFKKNPLQSFKELAKQTAGNAKAINASMDNSAIFRQGWKPMWTNPRVWQKNARASFGNLVKTFGGKPVLDEVRAEIISRPTYEKMMKAKLAVGNLEEAFPTTAPEKIPGLGRAYKASEVAYTAFVQKTRADVFDQYLKIAEKSGIDTNDPKELEAIGKLVNSLTGRGNLGSAEKIGNTVNNFFFSPRFVKSNWDTLTLHAGDKGITPFARKQAAKNLMKIVGGTAAIMTLANAVRPGSVELDPRSSDFGKIKIGDTRFDITGGMASIATLASRLLPTPGKDGIGLHSKSSITHQVTKLGSGKFGSKTGVDVFYDFFSNKLSPVPGIVRDYWKGQDPNGNQFSAGNEVKNLFTPIGVQNVQQNASDKNGANVVLTTILDGLGISASNYGATFGGNSPWEKSDSKQVTAFKQAVGAQKFKQASSEYNDKLNSAMTSIVKDKGYDSLSTDQQKQVITMQKAKLQKDIFGKYGFKYKNQTGSSNQLKKFLK